MGKIIKNGVEYAGAPSQFSDIEFGYSSGTAGGRTIVNFSRSHSAAPDAVIATPKLSATTSQAAVQIASTSSSNFTAIVYYHLTSNSSPALSSDPFYWIAIWK